jgi:hypothetical protein
MNINRVCFAGISPQSPKVNYSPKGTAVLSASIDNNEFYGCACSDVGRISHAWCEFPGKHYGYYDHDRYYHEGQSDENNYRSDRPSIDVQI